MALLLEEEQTWPSDIFEVLSANEPMLRAYEQHERATMDAYLKGNTPMALMPSNPHHREHERVLIRLGRVLEKYALRGWHCTRLTKGEQRKIREQGMTPPSLEMLQGRIEELRLDGRIGDDVAARWSSENQAHEEFRAGMIWFVFSRPPLSEESGVGGFFRYWGGEALYNSHDSDPLTGPGLSSVGEPCIIVADVPIVDFGFSYSIAEKFARRYLSNRGVVITEPMDHEDRTKASVRADQIVEIIAFTDPRFCDLTGCHDWDDPIPGDIGA